MDLEIVDINGFGDGVARRDGLVYFAPKTLVGDHIRVLELEKNKRFLKVTRFERLSSPRQNQEYICPHYASCGACKVQGLSDIEYQTWKQKVVQNSIRGRLASLAQPEFVWSTQNGFRTRTLFHIHPNSQKFCRVDLDGNLLEVEQCPILHLNLHPYISQVPKQLRKLPSFTKSNLFRAYLHFDTANHETVLGVILKSKSSSCIKAIKDVFSSFNISIFTALRLREEWDTSSLRWISDITPSSDPRFFTQTNPQIADLIHEQMGHWISQNEDVHLLDLFCGSGSHILSLQKQIRTGLGLESNPIAIQSAKRINTNPNIQFSLAKLPKISTEAMLAAQSCNSFVVNPPRAGIGKDFLDSENWVSFFQNARFGIYMSCNLTSLQRDLDFLLSRTHLRVVSWKLYDMFPWTAHTEALVLLQANKST